MDLRIEANHGQSARAVAWIGLQPNGSVSVGLADRAFISPRFRARKFVWNLYNRETVQFLVPHSGEELLPVMNPHLTFHPPGYFHLRANGDEELFAGIADVGIMIEQQGQVPWVRFTSRSLNAILPSGPPRHEQRTTIVHVPVQSLDVSIGLSIDFVANTFEPGPSDAVQHLVDWGGHRLHVRCEELPAQDATLAWYHES